MQNSVKILKDNQNNKVLVIKLDSNDSFLNDNNWKYLADIIKDGDKYYFIPYVNELTQERDSTKDVAWLIYSQKHEPEINQSYNIKEGDIIKLGNTIFKVKMIQVNNNNSNNYTYDNDDYDEKIKKNNNQENNTLMIFGSSSHSLVLNGEDKIDNILNLNKQKITIYPNVNKINNDIKMEKNKNKLCRICYQEEDESLINPLIRPCKCSGSMKYIHLKCLLFWLKSKTIQSQVNVLEHNDFFNAYFISKKMECELCKEQFPDYIKHNHIKYCLLDFDYMQEDKIKKSNNPIAQNYVNTNNDANQESVHNNNIENKDEKKNFNFIILDCIYTLNDGNRYRCIVKFNENNQIYIGRGLENQLVINEITVSRVHCLLSLIKNKFGKSEIKLEDDGSKFGTLILLQSNRYEILKDKPLHVQIGNVYLKMALPENKSLFSCCNANAIDEDNSYEKINSLFIKKNHKNIVLTEGKSIDEENDKDSNINKEIEKNNDNIDENNKEKNNIKNDNNNNNNDNNLIKEKKLDDDIVLYDIDNKNFKIDNCGNTIEKTDINNLIKDENKERKSSVVNVKKINIIKEEKDKKILSMTSPKNEIEINKNQIIDKKSEQIINKRKSQKNMNSEEIEDVVISSGE